MSFMIFQWLLAYGLHFSVGRVAEINLSSRLVGICAILRTRPSASESRLSGRAPKEEETPMGPAAVWETPSMCGVVRLECPALRHVQSFVVLASLVKASEAEEKCQRLLWLLQDV